MSDVVTDMVGKNYDDAVNICKENGLSLRIRQRDGVNLVGTADCKFDRVNVVLENNIVKVAFIG